MKKILILLFCFFVCFSALAADSVSVNVYAESVIVNGDVASAKIQAESRARWSAIESASNVKTSVSTIVRNQELLDESIKLVVGGAVKSFAVTDEGIDGDIYWMQASAVVEPDKARDSVSDFAKNTTMVVYLPMVMPDGSVEESHPLSENIINELILKGFEVVDMAHYISPGVNEKLSAAVQKNDMMAVRRIVAEFMAGSVLVGKLSIVDKGKDIGYGTVNFTIIDGELSYRLLGDKDGAKLTISSKSFSGKSQGATPEQAAYSLSKNMANRSASVIAGDISAAVTESLGKTVRIALAGNTDINKFNSFRDMVKNISWVLNVREVGVNGLLVEYPEKTLYLATIINKNSGYKIRSFNDNEIIVIPD